MSSDSNDSDGEYIPLHQRLAAPAPDGSADGSRAEPIRLDSSEEEEEEEPERQRPAARPEPIAPRPQGGAAARTAAPRPQGGAAEDAARRRQQREAARQRRQLDTQLRRAEAAARRGQRPEHCQKSLHALVDSAVLELAGGGELLSALQQLSDVTVHITADQQPSTVTWRRDVTETAEHAGQVVTRTRQEPEDQLVAVMGAERLASLVSRQTGDAEGGGLTEAMNQLGAATGLKVTVLCWGLDKLCRTKTLAGSYRQAAAGGGGRGGRLDRLRLEAAAVDALLDSPHSLRLVNSAADAGHFLAQITKAVAEAPFKRQRSGQQWAWFAGAEAGRPVKVDRQLRGLRRLWTEQLRLLCGGSLEAAQAVAAEYASPRALIQAYAACPGPAQRQRLVADLPVRRSVGPLVSSRRVGGEASRKLYLAMSATDGSTEL